MPAALRNACQHFCGCDGIGPPGFWVLRGEALKPAPKLAIGVHAGGCHDGVVAVDKCRFDGTRTDINATNMPQGLLIPLDCFLYCVIA